MLCSDTDITTGTPFISACLAGSTFSATKSMSENGFALITGDIPALAERKIKRRSDSSPGRRIPAPPTHAAVAQLDRALIRCNIRGQRSQVRVLPAASLWTFQENFTVADRGETSHEIFHGLLTPSVPVQVRSTKCGRYRRSGGGWADSQRSGPQNWNCEIQKLEHWIFARG